MRPLTIQCEIRDFADELRAARGAARRHLGDRPRKAEVAELVADHFAGRRGEHGAGYTAAAVGFGGRRWHYRCPACRGRAQRLFRPFGCQSWACGRCAGVAYPRFDRGWLGLVAVGALVAEVESFAHLRGRRPRRYHRTARRALALMRLAAAGLLGEDAPTTRRAPGGAVS